MGKPSSSDLRQRFVAAPDEGLSASAAGRRMRIARSTAVRWAATWRREGRAEALPMGGDRRSVALEVHAPKIPGWLEEPPDLYLAGNVARLAGAGIATSESGVARRRILRPGRADARANPRRGRHRSRGGTSPRVASPAHSATTPASTRPPGRAPPSGRAAQNCDVCPPAPRTSTRPTWYSPGSRPSCEAPPPVMSRYPLHRHRLSPDHLHPTGVRPLSPPRRIRCNLIRNGSRGRQACGAPVRSHLPSAQSARAGCRT